MSLGSFLAFCQIFHQDFRTESLTNKHATCSVLLPNCNVKPIFSLDFGPRVQLCLIIAPAVTSQSRLQTSHPLVVGPHPNSSQGRKIVSIEETPLEPTSLLSILGHSIWKSLFNNQGGGVIVVGLRRKSDKHKSEWDWGVPPTLVLWECRFKVGTQRSYLDGEKNLSFKFQQLIISFESDILQSKVSMSRNLLKNCVVYMDEYWGLGKA